jgi:RadC-like JAB domain
VSTRPGGRPRSVLHAVRVSLEPAAGLRGLRGRCIRTHAAAAHALARWLDPRDAGRRLVAALLDDRDRLLAIAVRDGRAGSACCLRPSEVWEPALLIGATRVWLAHSHASPELWATRQDVQSAHNVRSLGQTMGLALVDHVIVGAAHYASLDEGFEQLNLLRVRNGERRLLRPEHALARRSRPGIVPADGLCAPRFSLVGVRPVVTRAPDVPLLRTQQIASQADVAGLLAQFFESCDGPDWIAGMVDQYGRMKVVVLLDSATEVLAHAVYRAAIALDARQIYLARRRSGARAEASAADLAAVQSVYSIGFELGRPLVDALIFDNSGEFASLRTLGIGVASWRTAVERRDASLPDRHLRLHQHGVNRRPTAAETRRSEAVKAAVWRCSACQRRQIYKRACLYCGAARVG